MEITVLNRQKRIHIDRSLSAKIKKTVLTAVASVHPLHKRKGQINICLVNNAGIRSFNRKFLNKYTATDVIAFDMGVFSKNERIHAEIVISTDKAAANARIFGTDPINELLLYAAHGILHILGYDDTTATGRKRMQERAEAAIGFNYVHP